MGHENGGWMNSDQRESVRDTAESKERDWLRNCVTLVLRLARCLPRDHKVREQALDYLVRQDLLPKAAILRDTPKHLQLGSTERAKKECTCIGRCYGPEGLGEGWFCVMESNRDT